MTSVNKANAKKAQNVDPTPIEHYSYIQEGNKFFLII